MTIFRAQEVDFSLPASLRRLLNLVHSLRQHEPLCDPKIRARQPQIPALILDEDLGSREGGDSGISKEPRSHPTRGGVILVGRIHEGQPSVLVAKKSGISWLKEETGPRSLKARTTERWRWDSGCRIEVDVCWSILRTLGCATSIRLAVRSTPRG